ncbi:MAG: hypothetical protein HY319_01055 [Armatimonadetes bacterium]|nr:hypothetical protein [Armatimonadota bacterium]
MKGGWTFRYRDCGYGPAPIIPIQLLMGDHRVGLMAVVDTGATETLLEGVHLRAAGIDIFSGRPRAFQGFLGTRATAYLHRCHVLVGELEVDLEVAFSTQPLLREVLGRDILAHFVLEVRERAMELSLKPDPE